MQLTFKKAKKVAILPPPEAIDSKITSTLASLMGFENEHHYQSRIFQGQKSQLRHPIKTI